MFKKSMLGVAFSLLGIAVGYSQSGQTNSKDSSFVNTVLQVHNNFRAELRLPALVWSAELAKDAREWASHLAAIDKGQHDMSIRGKEGENLWWGTAGAFSPGDMVGYWGGEKKDFVYGVFPDVKKKSSSVVGHYTQIVWKNTTSVGCAIATNGKTDYLVCRYATPGNIIGQKPY